MPANAIGPGGTGDGSVPQAEVAAVLAALDAAFTDVVHARFGGGVHSAFLRAGTLAEQRLRAAPADNASYLVLELHLRDGGDQKGGERQGPTGGAVPNPAGFGHLRQGLATVIGTLTLAAAPNRRVTDIRVVTEVFDDDDGTQRLAGATTATGILLEEAGPSPGDPSATRGVRVVRGGRAQADNGRMDRGAGRGWLPVAARTHANRGGGLGSNGHRRAPGASLRHPVAGPLLRRIGDRLAEAAEVGASLERVVVGLELGHAPGGA